MCLNCGSILCGRYVSGHALHHSKENNEHAVCLNTLNCSVFCYICDDFVINDTDKTVIDSLRQEFRENNDDTSSEASTFQDESSSSKSQQETRSTSSSDSGWGEEPSFNRKLRPRKRTISSDSSESIKRKTLRKVVY